MHHLCIPLSDGEIAEMVFNTHMREYSDDDEDDDDDCDDIVNTSTKISIEDTVKMSDQLTAGLEHPAFIGEQGMMAVCSTKTDCADPSSRAV